MDEREKMDWRVGIPLLMAMICLLGWAVSAFGAEPSLTWNRNSETNIAGYKLYAAPVPGARTNAPPIDVGNTNLARMPAMLPGEAKFFQVTAYDTAGLESDPSEEVAYVVPWIRQSALPGGTRFEFLRVKANGNLTYSLELSEDLVTWTDQLISLPVQSTTLSNGLEVFSADVPFSISPRVFARVRIDIR